MTAIPGRHDPQPDVDPSTAYEVYIRVGRAAKQDLDTLNGST